jgi:hypothetical protein
MYLCSCIDPAWSTSKLIRIIEAGDPITPKEFMLKFGTEIDRETVLQMLIYPDDYGYFKNGDIYWYEHSAIEYFYKDNE